MICNSAFTFLVVGTRISEMPSTRLFFCFLLCCVVVLFFICEVLLISIQKICKNDDLFI